MAFINSGMSSTELRQAKADINNQKKQADKERTRFKKLLLAEFETRFAEAYMTQEIDSLHTEVDKMFKAALKKEAEQELQRIEEIIASVNDEQVDRKELSSATKFKGKSESYIISHIEEEIDAIIFTEDEVIVAQEPQPEVKEDFKVSMSFSTTDKSLAREVQNLCRKAGVRVTIQKG